MGGSSKKRRGPGGLSEAKKGAPLRKVVSVIRDSGTIFGVSRVLLECGHEAGSWGGVRARCIKCREEGRSA